jgi:hypothetical protein
MDTVRRSVLASALLGMALLVACAPSAPPPPAPPPGEWRSFEGTWTAAGDRRSIEAGAEQRASIVDLSGSVLLSAGKPGLGVGFQARVVAYADGTAYGIGRAVWTDERGDRIFSELHGAPVAAGRHLFGTITGGTGRWAGIEGEYRLEWSWVVETDEGRVQGRTVSLRGRARIAGAGEGAR